MVSPIDYASQLHNMVKEFERKTTPIESNKKIDEIVKFIQSHIINLKEDSLDEVQKAFKTRMNNIVNLKGNPNIRQIYIKLEKSNSAIDQIKLGWPHTSSETESDSDESI